MKTNKMALTTLLVFFLLISNLSQSSIDQSDSQYFSDEPSGTIKVVTSLSIISDWTSQIGKGLYVPFSVVSGLEDPHTYEPKPSETEILRNADIFIRFGLPGLEPWVQSIIDAYPSLNVLTLANISMMQIDPITGTTNPHIWMSPVIAKIFVEEITDAIVSLDKVNEITYYENSGSYLAELDTIISKIQGEYLDQLDGLKVVIHHPSFMYLFDLLGVQRMGVIEEQEGSEPSAQHIIEIYNIMKEENVSVIVTQPQIEEDLIIQIARDTGAKLAKLTPLLGIEGVDSYIDMIEYNVHALQNPEKITNTGWIITAAIIGGVAVAVVVAIPVYFRFKK